jgi:hypothetical protein
MGWFAPAGRCEPGYGREYLPDDCHQHTLYKDGSNPFLQVMVANNDDKEMLIVFQEFRQCRVKTRLRPGAGYP